MKNLLIVALVLIAYVVLAQERLDARQQQAVVYQTASLDLLFSHKYHIEEEALACDDCHSEVEASTSGRDDLLPLKETCEDCHDVEEPETCATCHVDAETAQAVPRVTAYSSLFSHERHLGADLTCESCHEGIAETEASTASFDHLPTMVSCMDCHEAQEVASNECMTCHEPGESLEPASHVIDFAHLHGDLARLDALSTEGDKTCQTCHDDNFCQDCHEGDNLDQLTHPLNFSFTHALDAQANELQCISCHNDRQFCVDCHRDNFVLPHSHAPGWANPIDGGLHRLEALNDLETCISCHEDNADTVCQPCHGDFN